MTQLQSTETATEKKTRRKAALAGVVTKRASAVIETLEIHGWIVERLQNGEDVNARIVEDKFGVNRFRVMAIMEAIEVYDKMVIIYNKKTRTYVFTNQYHRDSF